MVPMSSSARVVVLVVALLAFLGSVFLVVVDPGEIGSWFAAVATACVIAATVADMRFAKPLDEALIRKLLTTHEVAVTIEEAAVGGFGAHVLTLASDEGLIDAGLKLRTMRLPDVFQDQNSPMTQYDEAGLNAPHIVETVLKALRRNDLGADAESGAIA